MVGKPVGEFRQAIVDTLVGALECMHLNDVLRTLADVPAHKNVTKIAQLETILDEKRCFAHALLSILLHLVI